MNFSFFEKLSDKQKKVFYLMLAIVGIALLDRLCFGPIVEKTKSLEEEIVQQQEIIRRDIKFLGYSDRIIESSKAYSKFFTMANKDEDVLNAEFLSAIERLAAQSKVNLAKSNPAEAKKEKNYSEYYANLDCSGQLKDMVTFMHAINSSNDLLKVTRFNITPKRGADGEVNASLTVAKMIVPADSLAPAPAK